MAFSRGALPLYGVPGKMTRRLAAVVIGTQGLAVFFGALVARGLAVAGVSRVGGASGDALPAGSLLLAGSLLAVLCLLDAGLLRRPWGVTVGWALQIATLASASVVPLMLLVGLLFGALWVTALVQGHAMDEHTKAVDAQWYAAQEAAEAAEAAGSASPETPAQDG